MSHSFEHLIFKKGEELLIESQKQNTLFLQKNWWYKKMLVWTMTNHKLKSSLFRFIDVLPSLTTDEKFLAHWKEYFKDQEIRFITAGLERLAPSLLVKNIKKQILQISNMFITGSTPEESLKLISKNWDKNLAFSLDILGEEILSESEAEAYYQSYLDLMQKLRQDQKHWPYKQRLQKDSMGDIPAVNISIKASALFSQTKVEAWEYSKNHIKNKLRPLFKKAVQDFIFINLDMEYYHHKDLYLEVFKELLMEPEFKNYAHFGIVVQAYLKESLEDLKQLIEFCKKREQKITVRLVKGAYWDSEVLLAKQKNWPVPVYTNKNDTDKNFEEALALLFKEYQHIKIAVGSHNIRSIACALAHYEKQSQAQLEFQFLYGMEQGLVRSLSNKGYLTRLYCTMGDHLPGMSYLVRRLLENSANQSFILNSLMKKESSEKLLASPFTKVETLVQSSQAQKPKKQKKFLASLFTKHNSESQTTTFATKTSSSLSYKADSFSNFPLPDFSKKHNRDSFQQALQHWKTKFPVEVPALLKGQTIKSEDIFKRENPNNTQQIISNTFFTSQQTSQQAINQSYEYFAQWKLFDSQKRVSYLKNTAEIMKKDFFKLASLQVFEVGKTWQEACADVVEAIDFCSYYALSYEKLAQSELTDIVAGEENFLHYEAIGPTAVIAPWNFPLAILTGMTVAPLVCGNTVLIKPAEQSCLTAFELVKILLRAGFPPESFSFLPGRGEQVGKNLVEHPKVSVLSFTGSFEVGREIIKKAGSIGEAQQDIKKCIVEMGGKNAIIIDSSADLDATIKGVLESSFGFQGQKCSACSRVIILEDIYETFIQRFLPAVKSLVIGSTEQPQSSLGPLVDEQAFNKIQKFINQENSTLLYSYTYRNEEKSYFVSPTLYLSSSIQSALMQEELFAPVVTIFKVKTIQEAIQVLNQTKFALTAGLYSRHPGHIETFKSLVSAGNVYINRSCTGATVKRHPFGGYKMSGLGSKTGGKDYLKQFLHAKVLTENQIRRGFSPELF